MINQYIIKPTLQNNGIGGKAKNLLKLDQLNHNVPQWVLIPQSVLLKQLPTNILAADIKQSFEHLKVPPSLKEELQVYFGSEYKNKRYAVRSSANAEDGTQYSFAGQFESKLNVSYDKLEESILQVWKSVLSEHVLEYRKHNQLEEDFGISVIIQEMINPLVSGVAFGADPLSGCSQTKVITSVFGLGEGLVSGELNADSYTLTPSGTKSSIAQKSHFITCEQEGTSCHQLDHSKTQSKTLNEIQVAEIDALLDQLHTDLGRAQDIEFAYVDDELYLLQTRPITSQIKKNSQEYILWDNSNIVESYPGITTPLTYSFISKMYDGVYTQLCQLLGVSSKILSANEAIFANTLGLVRGRVYYNLTNWYKMLAMLPGYSINSKFMETMMGVKEKFDLEEQYKLPKYKAWFRIVLMASNMVKLHFKLPRQRNVFKKTLDQTLLHYQNIELDALSAKEVIDVYRRFEADLLVKWKAPLVNDFFSMMWFGILKKSCEKHFPNDVNMHNDLLCGSQDIISVLPIKMTLALARSIENDSVANELFRTKSAASIWAKMKSGSMANIKLEIDKYLEKFGERCIGELKLETISYNQDPIQFISILKNYVINGVANTSNSSSIEDELRAAAEIKLAQHFKQKPLSKKWFNYVLAKARDLVSNRENLRFERTRAFGMVRKIFSALGNRLQLDGIIENHRDVFYLELDEIVSYESEKSQHLRLRIKQRKARFESYRHKAIPQERFFTYGINFTDEFIYSEEKMEAITGDLKGIGCCPGTIKARVQVITDPQEVESLNGDILVTTSTDPGWVTLFPSASGIIVERGSLLSHSAIVSREMGIPCIVGVDGLMRTLKTGDLVLMDGRNGTIELLN